MHLDSLHSWCAHVCESLPRVRCKALILSSTHFSFAQAGTLRFQLLQEVPFCRAEAAGAKFFTSWFAGYEHFAT